MKITRLSLPGLLLLESSLHHDRRGLFMEAFRWETLEEALAPQKPSPFLQDNVSVSSRGVFRGLHLQRSPHAQSKLVRALGGSLVDFVVDVDPSSPYYRQFVSVRLDANDGRGLYIPGCYAHGFLALSDETVLYYKVDAYYSPSHEVTYDYRSVGISQELEQYISSSDLIVSPRDLSGQRV